MIMRLWLGLILTASLFGGPSLAQTEAVPLDPAILENIRKANNECFACHSKEGMKALPRQDMDVEKLKTMLHDVALYNISSHGRVECRTCHGAGSVVYPMAKICAA